MKERYKISREYYRYYHQVSYSYCIIDTMNSDFVVARGFSSGYEAWKHADEVLHISILDLNMEEVF